MTSRNRREGYFVPGWAINKKPLSFKRVNRRTGKGNGLVTYKAANGKIFFWPCKTFGRFDFNKGREVVYDFKD